MRRRTSVGQFTEYVTVNFLVLPALSVPVTVNFAFLALLKVLIALPLATVPIQLNGPDSTSLQP